MSEEGPSPIDVKGESTRLDKVVEHSAKTLKEHDFDTIGYGAGAVKTYADLMANGVFQTGVDISSEEAEHLINHKFNDMYGQTPQQYREGVPDKACTPWQSLKGKDTNNKVQSHSKDNSQAKEQDRGR